LLGVQEVASSSLVTPTMIKPLVQRSSSGFCLHHFCLILIFAPEEYTIV